MASTISPNMGLVIPGVGTEIGPAWANDLNASLSSIDSHNHTPGQGVQITTQGLNINSDLTLNSFNLIGIRSLRLNSQSGTLILAADVGCLYEVGVDLYFNDGTGTPIRITQSGGVAGTPGSIGNLVSPASVTYVALTKTIVSQSDVNIPANYDGGSIVLRNILVNSKGLTLSPPAAMASNYTLTLPAIPLAQNIMTLDTAGNISAPWNVDPTYLQVSSNLITFTTGTLQALVPPGVISPYAGQTAPSAYLLCDGTSILRSAYPALFAVIGTSFGAPDNTHFQVPDLRGTFLRGVSGSTSVDPNKTSRTAAVSGTFSEPSGVTVFGSSTVTVTTTGDMAPGMTVSGTGIPGSTYIRAILSATTFTLGDAANSANVLATASGASTLTISRSSLGNYVGSTQFAAFEAHTHGVGTHVTNTNNGVNLWGTTGGRSGTETSDAASGTTATETRPVNTYINYIIKT